MAAKKEKAPKAQDLSLEELAESGLEHGKITVSDDQKEEYAPYIGYIVQRYPSTKILRAANVTVTVFHFVPTTKTKGVVEKVTGPLTDLDPTNMFLAVDGQKIKFSNMYRFIVEGVDLEESEPQSGLDDRPSDDEDTISYEPPRKTSFAVDEDGLPIDDDSLSEDNSKFMGDSDSRFWDDDIDRFWSDDSSDFWPDYEDPFMDDMPVGEDDDAPLHSVTFSADDDCQIPYAREKQPKAEIKPWRKKASTGKKKKTA